uniref:E3 ubiquitin-protein ligase makorin-2 n=1 Tax=Oryzias melastigma TaxID=30732 RepID=A0A3B3CWQ7_ORYME
MSASVLCCRYFIHGVCREGSRCLFSHDLTNSKPSTICKFYQRGICAYGERCRYDHIKPPSRGGGASEETTSGSRASRGEGRRTLVLRDRGGALAALPLKQMNLASSPVTSPLPAALGPDGAFGGSSDGLGLDFSAAAAAPQSYVDAIRTGLDASAQDQGWAQFYSYTAPLCPYAASGHCFYEDTCTYLHGDRCDVCGLQVLHPYDPEQRRAHEKTCLLAFEADMEKAFAAQLSQDKVCSICMEVVVQKANPSDRRFGILSSCCHVFCLACIRQWRCTRSFCNKIIKSCPECRVVSEFVIPSVYWVEDQDEKDHLIELFKSGVSKKACKYFDQGRGSCPFGGKCLYLHAFPDGTRAEPDRPRKQLSSEGNIRFMNNVRLWDFIEEREQHSGPPLPPMDDDMMELQELFMQMSGPGQEGPDPPPTAHQ